MENSLFGGCGNEGNYPGGEVAGFFLRYEKKR